MRIKAIAREVRDRKSSRGTVLPASASNERMIQAVGRRAY